LCERTTLSLSTLSPLFEVSGTLTDFAQEALWHNSKAVNRASARKPQVVIPTLEDYESRLAAAENDIVPMPAAVA
jgi:hypothetical protein